MIEVRAKQKRRRSKVKRLVLAGKTANAIATALDCARATVLKDIDAMGLADCTVQPYEGVAQRRKRVRSMILKGQRPCAVAKRLGLSRGTVENDMRFLGLSEHSQSETAKRRAVLLDAVASMSSEQVAAKFNISVVHARDLRRLQGLPTERKMQKHERRRQIEELLAGGYSITEVAEELGVHYTTAYHHANALGRT